MCSVSPQVAADASRFSIPLYQLQELGQKAIDSKARAYCPYSKFRVGAALLTTDGQYITGANVENASYPVGTCAERVALGKAVSEGQMNFKALAVATDISPPASPCGMCRQFIREFCPLTLPIFMHDKTGNYVVKTLQELLPMSFGPEDLKPGPGPRSVSQLAATDVQVERGGTSDAEDKLAGAGDELVAADTII